MSSRLADINPSSSAFNRECILGFYYITNYYSRHEITKLVWNKTIKGGGDPDLTLEGIIDSDRTNDYIQVKSRPKAGNPWSTAQPEFQKGLMQLYKIYLNNKSDTDNAYRYTLVLEGGLTGTLDGNIISKINRSQDQSDIFRIRDNLLPKLEDNSLVNSDDLMIFIGCFFVLLVSSYEDIHNNLSRRIPNLSDIVGNFLLHRTFRNHDLDRLFPSHDSESSSKPFSINIIPNMIINYGRESLVFRFFVVLSRSQSLYFRTSSIVLVFSGVMGSSHYSKSCQLYIEDHTRRMINEDPESGFTWGTEDPNTIQIQLCAVMPPDARNCSTGYLSIEGTVVSYKQSTFKDNIPFPMKFRIGVLTDNNWSPNNPNTYTYTNMNPKMWLENRTVFPKNTEILKINRNTSFNDFNLIINPYGGVYPESDLSDFPTLKKIFDYVDNGGIFLNYGDIPGYWAYDPSLGKRVDTVDPIAFTTRNGSTVIVYQLKPFDNAPWLRRLNLKALNTDDDREQPNFTISVNGTDISIYAHRIVHIRENIIPRARSYNTQWVDYTPIFHRKYGRGYFFISLVPQTPTTNRQFNDNFIRFIAEWLRVIGIIP